MALLMPWSKSTNTPSCHSACRKSSRVKTWLGWLSSSFKARKGNSWIFIFEPFLRNSPLRKSASNTPKQITDWEDTVVSMGKNRRAGRDASLTRGTFHRTYPLVPFFGLGKRVRSVCTVM